MKVIWCYTTFTLVDVRILRAQQRRYSSCEEDPNESIRNRAKQIELLQFM